MKRYTLACVVLLFVLFDWNSIDAGHVALSRSKLDKPQTQIFLTNQTRDDDVDVKVEVNVSGRNSTSVKAPKIRTDKEVLQKILHNPNSKEHVKAVKILQALVKHLKVQNSTSSENATISDTPKEAVDLTPVTPSENIKPLETDNHITNSFSPSAGKSTSKKNKKKKSKKVKKKKEKAKKKLKQTLSIEKASEPINATNTKNTSQILKHLNKTVFTDALKQALIESTVKALRKVYRNKTGEDATKTDDGGIKTTDGAIKTDDGAIKNNQEETPASANVTNNSDVTSSADKDDKSKLSEKSSTENVENDKLDSKDVKPLPFVESTNINIPLQNQTKVVTNIYKIIIHKNDSKDLHDQQADYISQQNRDAKIQSFTRINNDTESGSAGNPDDEDENVDGEEDDSEEMNAYNANINRNKASTMSGKTLTITFQENAANLGGSSAIVKEPVLPGSSHLNLKINENGNPESAKQITEHESTPLIEETLKTDTINNSEGLLHESGKLRPLKLFNDSLFEEAGMKANDKKENKNSEDVIVEKSDKKSFSVHPNLEKVVKLSSEVGLGEEIDGTSLDASGSGVGSTAIGDELFFSKNERLSDTAEIDNAIPADASKQMKEKRDIITSSVKSFATSLLNHKLFIKKHPVNRVRVSDRDKPFKKHSINKSNKNHFKRFTRLHRRRLVSAPAFKRNELKLHKFDKRNVSLEDMSWNGEAVRYGSLVFKRNIVSEDDEPPMDGDEKTERFHKERILDNHDPPYIEASDKIFHKSTTIYNRRNEIPSREKLIAKRDATRKHKSSKNIKTNAHSRGKSNISSNKSRKVNSVDHQERGHKRLNIPIEVIGNEGETVDDLYKYGTEADIHTSPIFSDALDPFTQALEEKEKLSMGKSMVRPNIQNPLSVLDTPIIAGGVDAPQTQPGPAPVLQEVEKDAGQDMINYKNDFDLKTEGKAMLTEPESIDAVSDAGVTNFGPIDMQSSESSELANSNPNLQPEPTQPHGEAQINEEAGFTEMESTADPTAISPEMNQLENRVEQPLIEKQLSSPVSLAEESIHAKDEASKEVAREQAQETIMAEKKLKEMELARAQLELKARNRQNMEMEKFHLFQKPALRSASNSNNATIKIKPVVKKMNPKTSKAPVSVQTVKTNKTKLNNTIKKINKTNVATTASLSSGASKRPVKTPITMKNHTTEAIKIKTNFPPVWHLKVTKENAIGIPDVDTVFSKRNKLKIGKRLNKRDDDTKDMNNKNMDEKEGVNDSEKFVTNEADIPGVFAEKTDRKINRDFGSDNVDTETIVDDVRKRTPKLKNDVTIDEGLDTSKRHDVKKSGKITKKSSKENSGELEKRQKYFSPDADIQELRNEEIRSNFRYDGSPRHLSKDGYISNIQIVDSETPSNDVSEFTTDGNKKLDDAEFDSEYQR